MSPNLSKELVFLILQFLDDENFSKTAHMLEQETACYFNMKYFEDQVLAGEWDEVERYLWAFTKVEYNHNSMKILFEIRKQKYLESLDRQDQTKAMEILTKEFKIFKSHNHCPYEELVHLMPLENIREHEQFSTYGDATSARKSMLLQLRKLMESNPHFQNKLTFPHLQACSLKNIINQRSERFLSLVLQGALALVAEEEEGLNWYRARDLDEGIRLDLWSWVTMSPNFSKKLVFFILQFLDDENFSKTAHMLEQETACYFNMKYFEDQVLAGEWDEVERYLWAFTKVEYNHNSMKILFEIRKQKYLESLDRQDHTKAMEIITKEFKIFKSHNHCPYEELVHLMPLENIREHEQFSTYGDATSARKSMLLRLRKLMESNPHFQNKLAFPHIQAGSLKNIINQSLKWQHHLCKNRRSNPDMKTLFSDHVCGPQTSTNNSLVGANPKGTPFLPIAIHPSFKHGATRSCSNSLSFKGWMENPNPPIPHTVVAAGTVNLFPSQNAGLLKRPRTPPARNTGIHYHCVNSEQVTKRPRIGLANEVSYTGPTHLSNINLQDELPMKVARILNQGLEVTSMDLHPQQHTILLVGTSTGDIGIWDVESGEKLSQKTFRVWNVSNRTIKMQASFLVDQQDSVNRCIWSPDGERVGVAFFKNFIQTYTYIGAGELRSHLEIDAHIGGVNDISFSYYDDQKFIITCGNDKSMKIWDAVTGHMTYTFEGHEALVYSIFPQKKKNTQNSADNNRPADVKQRLQDEDTNKIKNWKPAEVSDSVHCRSLRLPDRMPMGKIVQLLYTNSGSDVLALDSNAFHKLWIWKPNESNPTGKATTTNPYELRRPRSESSTHDLRHRDPKKETSCLVLSKSDAFILSASGGEVSLLTMKSLKTLKTLFTPSPAATSFAFHPRDNNIIAFGFEDSKIIICYLQLGKEIVCVGHQKKITGLAFSEALNVLISSGADAKLCAWSMDGWKKQREKYVYPQEGMLSSLLEVINIQFHKDQVHLLVVQESHIAIYDASRLKRECHWESQDAMAAFISSAAYSCDSQLVYASFCDGSISVFDADILRIRCRILPSAFLPPGMSNGDAYPLTIAAHPLKPNQFAIGLTDGGIYLVEPTESQGKWGVGSLENGAVSSDSAMSSHGSEFI